ncbi:MAG: DUF502 domain-containing protein [Bacteroidales bacterium]|nr:DUF502 domain-containing protein [Bacteroidales bacterium]
MKRFWRALMRYFVQGLLYLVPIVITAYVILLMFNWVDDITVPYEIKYLGFQVPGLGLIIMLVFITLVGLLGSSFVFRPIIHYFELLINRAPLIKDLYSAVKDLMSAFVGGKKKFTEPVLVKMDVGGLQRIGFITQKNGVEEMGISKDQLVVYLPYSYGIMGTVIVVPKENVKSINLPSTEVMKFIVSGGVTKVLEKIQLNDKKTKDISNE